MILVGLDGGGGRVEEGRTQAFGGGAGTEIMEAGEKRRERGGRGERRAYLYEATFVDFYNRIPRRASISFACAIFVSI